MHKPIVAVDTYDVDEVSRYFGFAQPGEQVDSHVFALQSALVEKPQTRPGREYLRIAGRYVLTPEILRTLQNTHPVSVARLVARAIDSPSALARQPG